MVRIHLSYGSEMCRGCGRRNQSQGSPGSNRRVHLSWFLVKGFNLSYHKKGSIINTMASSLW